MDIKLKEIELEKRDILNNLMQLYLHNISLNFPMDFDSNTGMYGYDDIEKYFENDNNKAFFILKENEIAKKLYSSFGFKSFKEILRLELK